MENLEQLNWSRIIEESFHKKGYSVSRTSKEQYNFLN